MGRERDECLGTEPHGSACEPRNSPLPRVHPGPPLVERRGNGRGLGPLFAPVHYLIGKTWIFYGLQPEVEKPKPIFLFPHMFSLYADFAQHMHMDGKELMSSLGTLYDF